MNNKLNILLIEDDSIEVMKLNRALLSLGKEHNIIHANNGDNALHYLSKKKKIPDIILLDLNMPKINGIDFLKLIKSNNQLMYIPVIILTTSNNKKDLIDCFKHGVAGYILKPLKYVDYVSHVDAILSYWSINVLIREL